MRWPKKLWTTALLMAGLTGCKQQCFIKECDYTHSRTQLAAHLEKMPGAAEKPSEGIVNSPPPSTIMDPNRPKRFVPLAEAISLALENGTRGSLALNGSGDDNLVSFQGGDLTTDAIRVLALDPAIFQTQIEASLSKFDAFFSSSMVWNTTDRPIGTALDAFQAGRTGALNAIQTDAAVFNAQLLKPLPTGGMAGITFSTEYQFTNLQAAVNPAYTPSLQFQFEQPLLQGFGVEINQLRASHPGLVNDLIRAPGQFLQPTAEGILVTRIRYDQSRAQFEVNVAQMVLNVEQAYWNLYGAYWRLYSREQGLRMAYESWRTIRSKQLGGGAKMADVLRTRGQYDLFRGQRIEALGQVLEAERQLRKLLGLPIEDGQRLIPADTPTLSPYQPDWHTALNEALTLRPELVIAREDLKIRQLALMEQKNQLLPDLKFLASYDINAIGSRLDGNTNVNAFRGLAENNFNNWSLGFRLNIPLGYRQAYSNVRRERLALARSYAIFMDQEKKTRDFLGAQYQRLFELYEQIRAQRAQRLAYGEQLRLVFTRVGENITLNNQEVLEAQRFFSEALANEYNAIVQYNNTLALFEYAKGTLLHHNSIVIAEGELPGCAKERAADHHARRAAAILVREKHDPLHCTDETTGECDVVPTLPVHKPASLPSMFERTPKLPDEGEFSDLPAMSRPTAGFGGDLVESTSKRYPTSSARPDAFGASDQLSSGVKSLTAGPSQGPEYLPMPRGLPRSSNEN